MYKQVFDLAHRRAASTSPGKDAGRADLARRPAHLARAAVRDGRRRGRAHDHDARARARPAAACSSSAAARSPRAACRHCSPTPARVVGRRAPAVRGARSTCTAGALVDVARPRGRGGRPRRRLAGAHRHRRPRRPTPRVAGGPTARRTFCVDAGSGGRGLGPHAGHARSRATCSSASSRTGAPDPPAHGRRARRRSPAPCASGARRPAAAPAPRTPAGRVVLVGGGPGDVGLLTRRRPPALAEADVVVADRLGPVARARRAAAGRRDHRRRQDARATTRSRSTRSAGSWSSRRSAAATVVRLKGGDPFVYGRGGEEVLACREARRAGRRGPRGEQRVRRARRRGHPADPPWDGRSRARDERPRRLVVRGRSRGLRRRVVHGRRAHGRARCCRRSPPQALDAGADPDTPVALVESGDAAGPARHARPAGRRRRRRGRARACGRPPSSSLGAVAAADC